MCSEHFILLYLYYRELIERDIPPSQFSFIFR